MKYGLRNYFKQPIINWSSAIRGVIRAKVVSRHKSDKRAAELIFELLCENRFPTIWRRPLDSTNILEILKRATRFGQTTDTNLQPFAGFGTCVSGCRKARSELRFSKPSFCSKRVDEVQPLQRNHLFTSLENLDKQITELETWLRQ